MGNGGGCISAVIALFCGLLLIYVITVGAVFLAILVGVVWLIAWLGAVFAAIRERKAENSNPSRDERP